MLLPQVIPLQPTKPSLFWVVTKILKLTLQPHSKIEIHISTKEAPTLLITSTKWVKRQPPIREDTFLSRGEILVEAKHASDVYY